MPDSNSKESLQPVSSSSFVQNTGPFQTGFPHAVFRVHRVLQEPLFIRSGSHHHDFYEVLCYLEGRATTFVQGRVYHVQAGDLVLIAPYHVHSTVYHGDTRVARIGLWFNEAFLSRAVFRVLESAGLFRGFTDSARVVHTGSERDHVIALLEQMLVESERDGTDSQIMRRALLVTFLVALERVRQTDSTFEVPVVSTKHSVVGAVAEYLSEHYAEEITLPALSERFGTTPTSLARSFKRETQCTVIEYLQYLRITAAAAILRADAIKAPPIAEIALRVGFNNHRHFARVFGKIMNTSPREYRQKYVQAASMATIPRRA